MEDLTFYPVYVHHEPGAAYGVTIPDLPGVFSAADQAADIPRMAQEAVEAMYDSESNGPTPASPFDRYSQSEEYTGGFWMWLMSICPSSA
ncbi:type II toxin-antitoxin system HicB family antitoxin [Stenotrophomonas lacuserhaii]|uniref:type II toxin-antitoxin system HicB family antitoxin n=1 Tax=Stenotrophomonas lacuserhaii TaxID=2760084 RepID=UPI003877A25D